MLLLHLFFLILANLVFVLHLLIFFSNTSNITGNLRVFPESKQALNVTPFVLRMMQLVLFACAASLSSQS